MKNPGIPGRTLIDLGLSQYEAQAYIGLLGKPPATGYALANQTGIPQPKVYETLRRLAEKGYAVKVDDDPARYVAISPDQLLHRMEDMINRRLADARTELEGLLGAARIDEVLITQVDSSWSAVRTRAMALIEAATEHVYLSGYATHLEQLAGAIEPADARGVRFDILTFGNLRLDLAHGGAVRHDVTAGVVYRHHQDRHLAVVADSKRSLWAHATSGQTWSGIAVDGRLFASLVKEYVRHDLYVQRIFTEFQEPLEQRFGPGLQQLVLAQPTARESLSKKPEPAAARRTKRTKSA
jgi:sugar-specific transcriptional regulator TrmB